MRLFDRPELRIPLLRSGLLVSLGLLLVTLLQRQGFLMQERTAVTDALTGLTVAAAWGYLLAGAIPAGWLVRVLTLGATLTYWWPANSAMLLGLSGAVLASGLVIYLIWRWWQQQSEPVTDFFAVGAIMLLAGGVVFNRGTMMQEANQDLLGYFWSIQAVTTGLFASAVMLLISGSVNQAGVRLAGAGGPWLARLPAPFLLVLILLTAALRIGSALQNPVGFGWVMGGVLAALVLLWVRITWPSGGLTQGQSVPLLLGYALVFTVPLAFARGLLPEGGAQVTLFQAYVAGVVATGVALFCLATGRRTAAMVAGLAALWMLFSSDGTTRVPLPFFEQLSALPKIGTGVVDTLLQSSLAAWALWQWTRGRRSSGLYAGVLGLMLAALLLEGLEKLYSNTEWDGLAALVLAGATLYSLWVVVAGAGARQGGSAVAWGSVSSGVLVITFGISIWGYATGSGGMFNSAAVQNLGLALFWLPVFGYGVLSELNRLSRTEGRAKDEPAA